MTSTRPKCTITSYISLIVGWFHLMFSTVLAWGLLFYLCVYYERPDDNPKIAAFGLPVLLAIFTFSFASFIFDILLITGILARKAKLVSTFVIGNYMVLGFLASSAVFFFAEDYVHKPTKMGYVVNLTLHALTVGTIVYLFYPVCLLIQQSRDPPPNEHEQLSDSGFNDKSAKSKGIANL